MICHVDGLCLPVGVLQCKLLVLLLGESLFNSRCIFFGGVARQGARYSRVEFGSKLYLFVGAVCYGSSECIVGCVVCCILPLRDGDGRDTGW